MITFGVCTYTFDRSGEKCHGFFEALVLGHRFHEFRCLPKAPDISEEKTGFLTRFPYHSGICGLSLFDATPDQKTSARSPHNRDLALSIAD
ncbi:MAG: hypothetical protein ABIS29_11355 [Vicinamibacterales bacterium]